MSREYDIFVKNIKNLVGLDLSLYKEVQMKRRIENLKTKLGYSTFLEFYKAIENDKKVKEAFLDKVTINVTEFYRNAKRWDVLDTKIIPQLLKRNRHLKVWSAACSTGEEPYTLAMILAKHIPLSNVTILATDVDEKVLNEAKKGKYSERSLRELPSEMRKKHFTKRGSSYYVSEEIKNVVNFKKQNLLKDTFELDFDLIVCRNVMIYFTEEAKEGLYLKFSKSLRKDGILFVGSTEQIFNAQKYGFELDDTFFYRKK